MKKNIILVLSVVLNVCLIVTLYKSSDKHTQEVSKMAIRSLESTAKLHKKLIGKLKSDDPKIDEVIAILEVTANAADELTVDITEINK